MNMINYFLLKKSFRQFSNAVAMALFAISITFISSAGAVSTPAEKAVQKFLEKGEAIGFSVVLKTGSVPAEALIVSINSENGGGASMNFQPASKLACFTGSFLQEIDAMSACIDSLVAIDIDGDGTEEVLYARRGGAKQILEFFILKYKGAEKGKLRFEKFFSSPGINFGMMNLTNEPGKLPQILVHTVREEKRPIDVTYFFGFDKNSRPPAFKLINTVEFTLKD